MVQVGQQYRGTVTGRIVEVIHVGEKVAFVKTIAQGEVVYHPIGSEHLIDKELFGDNWKLYMPIVHTEEVFVKWHKLSGLRFDDEATCFHETPGTTLIGKVRFTYIEGGKLSVEVLE